ncbi:type IV inositol polyphosphate 5-phosphatase 3-like [Zingiber officinale]|uniref:type IV inositol polyphosphate 5-phosphatase 3-like n=1 Tax=Zingiber officinale TaxID=94328 RepID=UPI001C4C2200|nr:type IV inositol polyphosphate 5-phosphatase 3-like [Zingiber officinale]
MRQTPKKPAEVFWPKLVLRKWLNIRGNNSEFSADEGGNDSDFEDDGEENCGCMQGERERKVRGFEAANDDDLESIPYILRRRNSETLRAQYIDTKELRICAGTWNVGGQVPSDDLDIAKWIDMEEPADIYALGIQEIVPLNASNIFGAEDSVPVEKWEHLIRKTLNSNRSAKPKYKCYSDPSSPSRFRPHEVQMSETNSDFDEDDGYRDDDENLDSFDDSTDALDSNSDHIEPIRPYDMKQFRRLNQFTLVDFDVNSAMPLIQEKKLMRTLSTAERVGLVWPEQPLDLLSKHTLTNSSSFRAAKSFRKYNSFRPIGNVHKDSLGRVLAPEFDLNLVPSRKKRLAFVRIVSKQMIGIYLSIWVRRDLRKHIQNLKVSPVGVGVMGYIGNKGSISVSMSIYQTLFCFTCCHLSSGEKSGDELRRNADVQEIHRKTQFSTVARAGVPKIIHDHERIFWLGDLNYRIDLSFEETNEFISRKNWSMLLERDQLTRELKKGRAFDGWSEGVISFPPTYKYEFNSMSYVQDDNKGGRRNPAWCDRILWFGKGVKLLNYKRAELKLSDHRPVTAIFMAEVEIFCFRKLQKALTLTDAEIEDGQTIPDLRWRSRNTMC